MNRVRGTAMGCLLLLLASCGGGPEIGGDAPVPKAVLMDPQSDEMKTQAPDTYRVRFETSGGTILIDVERQLSPNGADRFYNLALNGYFDGCRFFRVVPGFIVQWGMNPDPALTATWQAARIHDQDFFLNRNAGGTTSPGVHARTQQGHGNRGGPPRRISSVDSVHSRGGSKGSAHPLFPSVPRMQPANCPDST